MPFTLRFPTAGPLPAPDDIASWLTEQGEPFEHDETAGLALRALPLHLHLDPGGIRASVDLAPNTPLPRLIRVLFDLSMRLGADVLLAGVGEVRRPELWLHLSGEQDRLRISVALDQAAAHHVRDEVLTNFWALLSAMGQGRDLRWDFARSAIVQIREVRVPNEERAADSEEPDTDTDPMESVSLPVEGQLHVLAWRWLSEAYPSLTSS